MQLKNLIVVALASCVVGDIFDDLASDVKNLFTSVTGAQAGFISSLASEASVVQASLSSQYTAFTATASVGAAASSEAASLQSKASAALSSFSSRASTAATGASRAVSAGLATNTQSTNGAAQTGLIGAAALFGGAAVLANF